MILEQNRLDAVSKTRSNLFNWRGQFTPEFVEYMLESFAVKGQHVLDPFSGSGTVLQEAARFGLSATGLEINPSAYAMSSFFEMANLTFDERKDISKRFLIKLNAEMAFLNGQVIYNSGKDYRESYTDLLSFINHVLPIFTEKNERDILLNILFQSERDKKLTVKDSLLKSYKYVNNCLINLPYTVQKITANLTDARCANDLLNNEVDLILTSPPYINVFNYHQNYRAIIESMQYNLLKVANSEFGANRKHRGNRFKTVVQYCIDMEMAIRSLYHALKVKGRLIMILGRESNVRGIPFLNGQLIIEIIEKCGGYSNVNVLERTFMNKFGMDIKEEIIIADKINVPLTDNLFAKTIALRHLEESLVKASGEVYNDIIDVILNIETVESSPLFNPKLIIK